MYQHCENFYFYNVMKRLTFYRKAITIISNFQVEWHFFPASKYISNLMELIIQSE